MTSQIKFIDPLDTNNHNIVLWCVSGADSFPTIFCCKISPSSQNSNVFVIWGYSVYRRSPGFRTLGQRLDQDWIADHQAKFFNDETNAVNYITKLITPKCDVTNKPIAKAKVSKKKILSVTTSDVAPK